MVKDNSYDEEKVRNQFTAYLVSQVRGRRRDYLLKQNNIINKEDLAENFAAIQCPVSVEEQVELLNKEKLMLDESKGIFPTWMEMEDKRIHKAVERLNEMEEVVIHKHLFEGMTFREISEKYSMSDTKVKNTYYYAIEKLKKEMKGNTK